MGGFDGGACEHSHHFVEEAISVKVHAVAVGECFQISGEDCAGEVCVFLFIPTVGGEGVEVVAAGEELERLLEDIRIKEAREMPCEASLERGEDGVGADVVVIFFSGGGKTGVEIGRNLLAGDDAYRSGEFGVDRGNPVVGVHGRFVRSIKMGGLAVGVDSGIGAAGAVES